MTTIALLLAGLVGLSVAVTSTTAKSPVDCSTLSDGYYADPGQCDAFIRCLRGRAIPRLCPNGLVFKIPKYPKQRLSLSCVLPFKVDCSKRPKRQPPISLSPACPTIWGLFKYKKSCTSFVSCVHGFPTILHCPRGLAFHPRLGKCTYADTVRKCSAENILKFKCPKKKWHSSGFTKHPHPTDCKKFIFCLRGKPRLAMCVYGQVFNPKIKSCSPVAHVPKCKDYYKSHY